MHHCNLCFAVLSCICVHTHTSTMKRQPCGIRLAHWHAKMSMSPTDHQYTAAQICVMFVLA